jgi:predicted Ser/Thr protein kinase
MPCTGWEPAAGFLWEAKVYMERLQPLQGSCVPQLLGFGYISNTPTFFMALSVVRGTPLAALRRPLAAEVRAAATEALRRVHEQGVLHGDVRLDHMVLVAAEAQPACSGRQQQQEQRQQREQQPAARVVILDFDHAKIGSSRSELRREEELLQSLLAP